MSFTLSSAAFKEGESIPSRFSCDGDNISPEMTWKNAPEEAESLVLICDDPDAPMGTFVHWVVYNIPSCVNSLPEGFGQNMEKPSGEMEGTCQGLNNRGKSGYTGPCPPPGPAHHYHFKLYALDTTITGEDLDKAAVQSAMEGHILAEAILIGQYKRAR